MYLANRILSDKRTYIQIVVFLLCANLTHSHLKFCAFVKSNANVFFLCRTHINAQTYILETDALGGRYKLYKEQCIEKTQTSAHSFQLLYAYSFFHACFSFFATKKVRTENTYAQHTKNARPEWMGAHSNAERCCEI